MVIPRRTLGIENLETRLNLSSTATIFAPATPDWQSATRDQFHMSDQLRLVSLLPSSAPQNQASTGAGAPGAAGAEVAAPSHIRATPTALGVRVTWIDQASNEQGYRVLRSTDGANYQTVSVLDRNTMGVLDTTAESGITYYYKVQALGGQESPPIAPVSATTPFSVDLTTPISPPASPGLPSLTATPGGVTLTWADRSNDEDGFRVYRSDNGVDFSAVVSFGTNASGWTDLSVQGNTSYWYKVTAWNAGGEIAGASADVVAAAPGPSAPTALRATTTTTRSVSLAWTDTATDEQGFKVYRSTDGTNFTVVTTLGANTAAWTDTRVTSGTNYWYKIGAYNTLGEYQSDAIAAATPVAVPLAPTNLGATVTTTSVALHWTDKAANETGSHIYRTTDRITYTLVATLDANTSAWTDTNVTANTRYWYKIGEFNTAGEAQTSALVVTTLPLPPAAPSNLAVAATATSASLTWADNASNEVGYRVYRSTDGTNYTVVAKLGANNIRWTDTHVIANTTYMYKVGAYNAGGESKSDPASVTAQAPAIVPVPTVAVPAAATNLTALTTTTSVALTWTDNSANEDGVKVYRSADGASFSLATTLAANATSWTDTTVSSSTTYWYKLGEFNAGGETASATLTATTQTPAPPTATNLAATTTTTSVALAWTTSSTNLQGIKVYRSTDGANFALVTTLAATATSWTDTTVSASTTYWYKLGDYNSAGETLSAVIAATTKPPAPAAATNLAATTTTTSVALSWTDNATTEQGVRVYRSTNGATFTLVANLGANATSWTDTAVSSSTAYWYKVGEYNAGGEIDTAALAATTPAPAAVSGGVTASTRTLTSFNELVIRGTSSNDSIVVTQSNGVLTVTANGQTSTYAATFGDIKIYGVNGNDVITVDSSVNIASLIYGGDGNDVIQALGSAKMTVVTIGNGTNTITGNGLNTAYWVNAADTVNATAAEIALGGVNRVGNFYQPFTTNTADPNYVARNLYGQNLTDPTDSGVTMRRNNSSFFGTGPTKDDINQGYIADCYYVAGLSAMAYTMPQKLMNMGVDLGDGTYAVRYVRSGVTSYVRVDGDMYTSGVYPGANGNQWASVFEKAYAFFRSGANSYASLGWGSSSAALRDAGLNTTSISTSSQTQATLLTLINAQLAAGKPIVANTSSTIATGVPLIGSHAYTVIGAYLDSAGQLMIQLRNPWGYDGAGNDGNYSDAIVTVGFTQLTSSVSSLSYMV